MLEITSIISFLGLFLGFMSMTALFRIVFIYSIAMYSDRKVELSKTETIIAWLSSSYILTYLLF